jgi:hypothetical protein
MCTLGSLLDDERASLQTGSRRLPRTRRRWKPNSPFEKKENLESSTCSTDAVFEAVASSTTSFFKTEETHTTLRARRHTTP